MMKNKLAGFGRRLVAADVRKRILAAVNFLGVRLLTSAATGISAPGIVNSPSNESIWAGRPLNW
jgi:hypothetical protein